jgi:putative ABC transport system permease protein
MLHDLKAACRDLIKHRAFTCVVVLTLALGIGANTAIFGVVNRLLLNPLPYPDAERIVYLQLGTKLSTFGSPTPDFVARAWRAEARSLDGIEAYELHDVLAYDDSGARVVRGTRITPSLPTFLGVAPLLGRGFTVADAAPRAPAVVLLSYETWQRDYGGARDVLGRAIRLDDVSHVVIGVMPARWDAFSTYVRGDLWLPLSLDAPTGPLGFTPVNVFAKIRPEVPIATVTGELDGLMKGASAAAARPLFGAAEAFTRIVRPADLVATNTRDALLVLTGAVALVLLVACSNVANLLLARGASRARAFALRAALGASTWRLVRALLTECLVLALVAGAVGVAIGWLSLDVLVRLRPDSLRALDDVRLDPTVLAFTFGISLVTALLFGLVPAAQVASAKFGGALRHGASGMLRGSVAPRLRKLLVAAQMALSVILLLCAGLLVRSVVYLQQVDVGFDTSNLFSVQLSLPRERYQQATSRDLVSEQLLEQIRSLPDVAGATQAFVAPTGNIVAAGGLEVRGATLSEADARAPYAFNFVRPDYFGMLGIRLLEGRTFTTDELRSGKAVIVNRSAAERFWPEGNAVGAEMRRDDWATVVGVADDTVSGGLLRQRDTPLFYWPFQSDRVPTFIGATPGLLLLVRSTGDPAGVIAAIRAATKSLDPEIAIPNVLLTETALAASIDGPRFNMALLAAFALIALALAAVGLATVIGYEITERTHEIGVRVALGARAADVRRLAMRHGLTPAVSGVICGVLGALAATELAASLLYGVTARDPLTFVGVVALLLAVAVGASWLPARRAARVDPITALRAD